MSKEALAKVVQRAISDGAFRRQLSTDPATALRGFDLTADEAAAIRSGDAGRLTAMGVELRMSKAFTLSTDNAPGMGANAGVNSALNASANSAFNAGANSAFSSGALISGDPADNAAILTDGGAAGREAAVIPGGPAHALGALTGTEGASASAAIDDANAEGFLTAVHTTGENTMNPVIISTESPTASSVLTAGEGASLAGAETDANSEGFLTSVNTTGDNSADRVLVVDDDNVSGAASPGEALDGPSIQQ